MAHQGDQMARLPQPGKDAKTWGDILNEYLLVSHNPDGTLRDSVVDHRTLKKFAVSASNIAAGSPSDGQVLVVDSSQPGGLAWRSPSEAAAAVAPIAAARVGSASGDMSIMAAAPTTSGPITVVSDEAGITPITARSTGNVGHSTEVFSVENTGTIASGAYAKLFSVMAPSAATGSNLQFTIGRSKATANCAEFTFTPQNNQNDTSMMFGFYSRPNIFRYNYRGDIILGGDPYLTSSITLNDRKNFVFSTANGTKIGTAANQKLSFYGATPIAQPSGDILTALGNLGLVNNPTVSVNTGSLTGLAALATRGGYEKATVATSSSGTTAIDLNLGNIFHVTISANTTFAFQNPAPTGYASSFSLYVRQDGTGNRTVNWPSSVKWAGGKPPASTGVNTVDLYVFETFDGGATWYGAQAGANFA